METESEVEVELESEGTGGLGGSGSVRAGWSAVAQIDNQIGATPLSPIRPGGHRVGLGVATRSAVRRGGAWLRRGLDRKWERKSHGAGRDRKRGRKGETLLSESQSQKLAFC